MPLFAFAALLAAYLHRLDPVAFHLGPLPIRWYGLSYLAGFVVGYFLVRRVVRVGVTTLKPPELADFVFYVIVGIILGGRLGYVLFYRPSMLWTFSEQIPWWELLAIHHGGMSSHGGIAGAMLAAGLYARRHHHSWPHLIDLLAFGAPLGLLFGRIANFINGELFGRPIDPASPARHWAVKFPQEMYEWNPAVPADAVKLNALTPALEHLPAIRGGQVFQTLEQQIHALVLAVQQGHREVIAIVEPLLIPRHPSQLYQGLLEGPLIFLVMALLWLRPRRPMVLGAAFSITYSIGRMVSELFRLPDEHLRHLEAVRWGITRGQWLSGLLLLLGITLLLYARGKGPLMGGWLPVKKADKPGRNGPAI